MDSKKLAQMALKMGDDHAPFPLMPNRQNPSPGAPRLINADDAGLFHGGLNSFSRFGKAVGRGGLEFLNGFDKGYAMDQGSMPGKVFSGTYSGSKDFLKRFWDEGGTSAALGIGGMGLAGYGAKKLYDKHFGKPEDPYAGMYPQGV